MTVVIDCNIFVMCLTSSSPYHIIYKSLINAKFNIAVTNDILLEYEEITQQKYNIITAKTFMSLLSELPNVTFVNPHFQWRLIESDPDDNKYCDCAIAGQAAYLVTQDKHFDVLASIPFPSLTVINIDQFLEMLIGTLI